MAGRGRDLRDLLRRPRRRRRLQQRAGDVAADRLDEVADDLARPVLLVEAADRHHGGAARRPGGRVAAGAQVDHEPLVGQRLLERRPPVGREPRDPRQPRGDRQPVGGDPVGGRHDAPQRARDQHALLRLRWQLRQPQPLVEHARVDLGGRRGRRRLQRRVARQLAGLARAQPERLQRPPGLLARARAHQRRQHPLPLGPQRLRVGELAQVHGCAVRGRGLALGGREQDQHGAEATSRRRSPGRAGPARSRRRRARRSPAADGRAGVAPRLQAARTAAEGGRGEASKPAASARFAADDASARVPSRAPATAGAARTGQRRPR